MDLLCPLWGAATTESVKSWKNGQKYRNFLGKTDKMPPFYIRKTDKDMIKRKIDRYLADFVSFSENTICKRTR